MVAGGHRPGRRRPQYDADTPGFLELAADTFAALPWSADLWHELTGELKQATGRKGAAIGGGAPVRTAISRPASGR